MNQTTDAAYIRQMLKACLEIPSPCGDTEEISQFLKKELEAMGIETKEPSSESFQEKKKDFPEWFLPMWIPWAPW